jgi:hypothetical protein
MFTKMSFGRDLPTIDDCMIDARMLLTVNYQGFRAATQIDGVTSPTGSLAAHRAITQIVWIGMS